jgi:hypothetical protein
MRHAAWLFHRHAWALPLACFAVISVLMNLFLGSGLGID